MSHVPPAFHASITTKYPYNVSLAPFRHQESNTAPSAQPESSVWIEPVNQTALVGSTRLKEWASAKTAKQDSSVSLLRLLLFLALAELTLRHRHLLARYALKAAFVLVRLKLIH